MIIIPHKSDSPQPTLKNTLIPRPSARTEIIFRPFSVKHCWSIKALWPIYIYDTHNEWKCSFRISCIVIILGLFLYYRENNHCCDLDRNVGSEWIVAFLRLPSPPTFVIVLHKVFKQKFKGNKPARPQFTSTDPFAFQEEFNREAQTMPTMYYRHLTLPLSVRTKMPRDWISKAIEH